MHNYQRVWLVCRPTSSHAAPQVSDTVRTLHWRSDIMSLAPVSPYKLIIAYAGVRPQREKLTPNICRSTQQKTRKGEGEHDCSSRISLTVQYSSTSVAMVTRSSEEDNLTRARRTNLASQKGTSIRRCLCVGLKAILLRLCNKKNWISLRTGVWYPDAAVLGILRPVRYWMYFLSLGSADF